MPEFPHLQLRSEIDGLYKSRRGQGRRISATTRANLDNRQAHGAALISNVERLVANWRQYVATKAELQSPDFPYPEIIPVFLQVDPNTFDVESLKGFGIEIISEEDSGFIIGAASQDFDSLRNKIERFINEASRSNKAAELWQINDGIQWRVDQILSQELQEKWESIEEDQSYVIDVGIACYVKIADQPEKKDDETDEHFQRRYDRWIEKMRNQETTRDDMARDRQDKLERLVRSYNGEFISGYIDFEDSFNTRIKISGKGLKDIVFNYPFIFEIIEYDPYTLAETENGEATEVNPELVAPHNDAPTVCVIDSGIQEGHRLLAPAMAPGSMSFIPADTGTADSVVNGGHGTRVAGAILYPGAIPRTGQYQLPFFIQNARVLSGPIGVLSEALFPPRLMTQIVSQFGETRVFNLSINSHVACRTVHMSQWAATIDKLMFERNILFVTSAGNLFKSNGTINYPGIRQHLINNLNYPDYLWEDSSRIANPGQSCFALTVGSVCIEHFQDIDRISFGHADEPSSFSRTGIGLWGMVKPDVVEYGGDFIRERVQNPNLSLIPVVCPELVRSTLHTGSAIGRDAVGTSYAAPKVSHIVAQLQAAFPDQHVNLYRALLVQSARLPGTAFRNPTLTLMRHFGYGIPNAGRAINNSETRVTLTNSGFISPKRANVYAVRVPTALRGPATEYEVLVEVTLSYMAQPRRTRRRTQSYLSTWLDWHSSKLNETHDHFCGRIVQNLSEDVDETEVDDQNSIPWVIRERKDWSRIEGLRRQDSTLQKSWCILPSHSLPSELSIAVVGHKGWNKDLSERVPYSIVVSFEVLNADINIYEMIRVENEVDVEVTVRT